MMEYVCRLALAVAVSAAVAHSAPGKQAYPLRDAVEFTVRGGCPNFFRKLSAGKAVKIAYLGGSITAQNGWPPKTLKWFREQYPDATVDQIHAAIGGTGSDLGVFRLQGDVLQHKPDLLFVEFAVNDGGAPPDRITKSMEGIVRQAWAADPNLDICFVYTATQPDRRKTLERRAGPNEKVLALDDAAFAKRFDGTEWYAGYIMFIGEFVK